MANDGYTPPPRAGGGWEEGASQTRPGKLLTNLVYFTRTLRYAGLPIGPGRLLVAIDAVRAVGLGNRRDFYAALRAVFINRRDQRELFDQAFYFFWRNPRLLDRALNMVLPQTHLPEDRSKNLSRRLAEAMAEAKPEDTVVEREKIEIDGAMTASGEEVLRRLDFEKMSGTELAAAKREIAGMRLPIVEVPTRRFAPDAGGPRIDLRATLRSGTRGVPDLIILKRQSRRLRHPPLVVLCDVSGSMSRYSRLFLHFMHAITNDRDRVHTFLFGTRLTNITRYLRTKDVDVALDEVSNAVVDWGGGTRIGACLNEFNRLWSRRVLGQGAVVLLITDGLDREAGIGLEPEMERLHKSCRRLIWLNPLLRFDRFEPKSKGVRAMLPHVDDFKTVHNLESLSQLTASLRQSGGRRLAAAAAWRTQLSVVPASILGNP